MAHVADHLTVEALEERYAACEDATSSRHFQAIWLLAKGRTVNEVADLTLFGVRWIEQLQSATTSMARRRWATSAREMALARGS